MDDIRQEIDLENMLESIRQASYRRRRKSLSMDDWMDWMNEELKREHADKILDGKLNN